MDQKMGKEGGYPSNGPPMQAESWPAQLNSLSEAACRHGTAAVQFREDRPLAFTRLFHSDMNVWKSWASFILSGTRR